MIFLIEYDRPTGKIIALKNFAESQRLKAEKTRVDLELELNRKGVHHEVVLLEAASEEALRRTHRRYFENLSQLVQSTTSHEE
jgi:hypothetical protein